MFLVDYHTHSCCSTDSTARLEDMALAARQAGLAELCTTDHCDLLLEDGSVLDRWDWAPVLAQYERTVRQYSDAGFRLLLGIELGGAHTDPDRANAILSGAPLDFVIGSVHNLSPAAGGRDFYFLDYPTEEFCCRVLDDYFSSLLTMAKLPYYDALGHIIYPLRYMNGRGGHHIALSAWSDPLDELLRIVIETGRAIEVNTHSGQEIAQWLPVLERYRALGGELITVGSDAHSPKHVGKGVRASIELLCETGFRWLTVYRQRKPEQIKL